MLGVQILGVLFAMFMMYLAFLNKKRSHFTNKEYFAWMFLWIVFVLITIFPTALSGFVVDIIALQRPLDFYIITGFMFLIGSLFYTYALVRQNQRKLEEIVRKAAIESAEKK